ncbi:MAG TPA: universal stress protein [Mucilaginibacter sp.]|jgi:nucleotide-binding universal stress UspA family protein|nr:universal stress protein [Mucilaginibacter sp.]
MKTYIVPVDFSATSVHAAEYAAVLSKQTVVEKIILLHSYYISVYQSVLPTPDMVILSEDMIEDETQEKLKQLKYLRIKLLEEVRAGVEIDVKLSRSTLTRSIIETISDEDANLVILGSNGMDAESNSHVGINAINISKLSPIPVVVVPPGCYCEPVKRVVMACDFQKITDTFPLMPLQRLLARHDVELLVVNIDKQAKHKHADPQQLAEESALYKMLKEYHPKYFYNESDDIIRGILDFSNKHHAQLVIALPHKYSFFQSLLHESVSKQLTVKSAMPVLLLK